MQVKITVEYDGSDYFGWQLQAGQDSIQGRIERALGQVFATPIRIRGSGRTDAGVHALGQVASFALPRPFELPDLHRALNALLPPDIVVKNLEAVPDSFDPRRDARSRLYEYRILNRALPSAFEYRHSWHVREALDLDRMNRAARLFVGEHDFAAFRTLGTEMKSTVRRVIESEWTRTDVHFIYRTEGSSFMRHMVRTMVALMVDVGRGKTQPETVSALLETRNRAQAPAPAPSCGLFLVEVRY